MPNIKVTTVRKARGIIEDEKAMSRKRRRKSPVMLEYESYLLRLERGKAIEITLKDGDKFQTIRYRLNNAARSLRIKNLRIQRAGNKVICYREAQARAGSAADKTIQIEPVREGFKGRQPRVESLAKPASGAVPEDYVASEPVLTPKPKDLPVEAPAPLPEESGHIFEFEFDEECEMPMVYGVKTCETRAQRYAHENFEAFGHQYVITKVKQLPLGEVQQKWFKQHGLFSPREFKEVWRQRNKGDFDPEQMVWVHQFKRGFAPPTEPDEEYDVGDAESPGPRPEID